MEDAIESLRTGGQQPILHRRINFIPAKKVENGRNPKFFADHQPETAEGVNDEVLQKTTKTFSNFKRNENPAEKYLEWEDVSGIGRGLSNMGHNSFINAVTQCLAYCPPFAQMLLSDAITSMIEENKNEENDSSKYCALSCLRTVVNKLHRNGPENDSSPVSPQILLAWLHYCAPALKPTKERSSLGFLDVLLDSSIGSIMRLTGGAVVPLQTLQGENRINLPKNRSDTFVDSIFNGTLACRRKCSCDSEKFPIAHTPIRTISFSGKMLKGPVERVLEKYLASSSARSLFEVKTQDLDECSDCKSTELDICIEHAPLVLTLSCPPKRGSVKHGDKLASTFDLPVLSNSGESSTVAYNLTSLIVGHPPSSQVAYVKAANGMWYQLENEYVRSVKLKTVVSQAPSMMFYIQQKRAKKAEIKLPKKQVVATSRSSQVSKSQDSELLNSVQISRKEMEKNTKNARKIVKVDQKNEKAPPKLMEATDSLSSLSQNWQSSKGSAEPPQKQYKRINTSLFGEFLEDVSIEQGSATQKVESSARDTATEVVGAKSTAEPVVHQNDEHIPKSFEKDEIVVVNRHGTNKSNNWKSHLQEVRKSSKRKSGSSATWKKRARYDEWDKALDAGKQKKVKNKEEANQRVNLRDALQNKQMAKQKKRRK